MGHVIARAASACAAAGFAALVLAPSAGLAQVPPGYCTQIASLTANGLVAGATNGIVGTPPPGLGITMTASLGTATAGTFRIVGDPAGTVTYAGPKAIPGTLTYTTTGSLPPGAIGVGFFIDTATGGTVNITAACSAVQVPTTSQNALIAMAALLLAIGTAVLYRRRSR
jgi:hypothetical protein